MFGYVTIYQKDLDNAAMDCYQAYYCGLCQSLGRKYGTAARMALSYDMTFAALLLTALYDPPTQTSQGRCVPHPLRTRPRAVNEFTDYAADMTVVLAYYNYLDDWQDDHKRSRLRLAKQLEPHLENIRRQWPRQCEAIHTKLDELNRLESANSADLDALCNAFGALLGAVFSPREDFWSPALTQMGRGLGGFIYLMDAYDDLKKDAHKQPNYQADQRRYAQKVAKSITAVPPGHKTLEPCLHLKHAILLNTGVPQKPKSRPLRC